MDSHRPDRSSQANTQIPSGAVAFLFTDIEGSTARWERAPQAMAVAMQLHDETIQAAIDAWNGYVFKTVGDAFCASFERATDALEACVRFQLALASIDFSAVGGIAVRAAVHLGEAYERDGDYFGPTVNRTARLMSIGHGGQVLLSGTVADSVRSTLDERLSLRSLGVHRLRDLTAAEHVYQLVFVGLGNDFPALQSVDVLSENNLPLVNSALIGRKDVVDHVLEMLRLRRLVTIVGPGGVGKTRVALQVAADLMSDAGAGTWFVDLAPILDSRLVEGTIASALGIRTGVGGSVLDVVVDHLKDRNVLILLDNCEHVVLEAARIADVLVKRCSSLRILATSREALNVEGERVFRLPSLERPEATFNGEARAAMRFAAVELFVERARSADDAFRLTDAVVPDVVRICSKLDGIPLAIELAAARTSMLQPHEIARQLDERFQLLVTGRRTVLPRQQTLRATLDWSYDLLLPQEQTLFDRLAVFSNGWTLAAAEEVCVGGGVTRQTLFEAATMLVEKSLVVAHLNETPNRYRFLESTRAYALEKLRASKDLVRLSEAHLSWVVRLTKDARERRGRIALSKWLASIEVELENIREALRFAEINGRFDLVARIAADLTAFWFVADLIDEGRAHLEGALAHTEADASAADKARIHLALARLTSGEQAKRHIVEAIDLSETVGDHEMRASSYGTLAWVEYESGGHEQAERASEMARTIWRSLHQTERYEYACELDTFATILTSLRRHLEARRVFHEASSLFERLGEEEGAALSKFNLAELEFAEGNIAEALRLIAASSDVLRRLKSRARLAMARTNQAGYLLAAGCITEAFEAAREVLEFSLRLQIGTTPSAIEHLAAIAATGSDLERAGRLAGYVDATYSRLEFQRSAVENSSRAIIAACLEKDFVADEIRRLAAIGAKYRQDEAVSEALAVRISQGSPA